MDDTSPPPAPAPSLNGTTVVLGMIGFGVIMTGALWLYWELYTRPFRPLQEAIATEFTGSQPRVIGGRHKSHTDENPSILRIVVRVEFDPTRAGSARVDDYAGRLHRLARQHADLSKYETLEIHLTQWIPEKQMRERMIEIPIGEGVNP